MKIGSLASKTGLSVHTLRYYERIGLLPRADRDSSKQRDFDASILPWIAFLGRLKTTGMPIRDMLVYARLREKGDATEGARRALLDEHRARVRAHVAELQVCLFVLDGKIDGYDRPGGKETSHDTDQPRGRDPVRARMEGARAD